MKEESSGAFRFKVGDAFRPGDPVARFVIVLGMVANDLIRVNKELIEIAALSGTDVSPESVDLFWHATSLYRESIKFLDDSLDQPEVRSFVASLPPEAQELLAEVELSYTPWKGSFAERVTKPIRDGFFHFPGPNDDRWKEENWDELLERLALTTTGIAVDGPTTGDVRFGFSDEVRATMLAKHLGASKEEMGATMGRLANLIGKLTRFCEHAIVGFVGSLPEGVVEIVRDQDKEAT